MRPWRFACRVEVKRPKRPEIESAELLDQFPHRCNEFEVLYLGHPAPYGFQWDSGDVFHDDVLSSY
jgi:hypothetical protein